MNLNLPNYKYNGARSMIILHEQYLRSFVETWKLAKANQVVLPETEDLDYASMQTLLRHVFRAARGYITWMCERLQLLDPQIDSTPAIEEIESEIDNYLEHLLDEWRLPLTNVDEEKFMDRTYKSRWGVDYCIDAMLEHAVMHPIRHEFQLKNLMDYYNNF